MYYDILIRVPYITLVIPSNFKIRTEFRFFSNNHSTHFQQEFIIYTNSIKNKLLQVKYKTPTQKLVNSEKNNNYSK